MSRIFTGSTTYLLASSVPASLIAAPLSISAWVKLSQLAIALQVVNIGVSGSLFNRFALRVDASGFASSQVSDASTTQATPSTVAIADTTTWHLITAVFSANNARASYLDGGNVGTSSNSKSPTIATTDIMRISAAPDGTTWHRGNAAYIATWNIGLSAGDVANLFTTSPDQVQGANLVNYWGLLNNQSPEPDAGPAGVDMVVNGPPTFSTDNPAINFGPIFMPWVRA